MLSRILKNIRSKSFTLLWMCTPCPNTLMRCRLFDLISEWNYAGLSRELFRDSYCQWMHCLAPALCLLGPGGVALSIGGSRPRSLQILNRRAKYVRMTNKYEIVAALIHHLSDVVFGEEFEARYLKSGLSTNFVWRVGEIVVYLHFYMTVALLKMRWSGNSWNVHYKMRQ